MPIPEIISNNYGKIGGVLGTLSVFMGREFLRGVARYFYRLVTSFSIVRTPSIKVSPNQSLLGAEILSPYEGEVLKTFNTGGLHPIRIKCKNDPNENTYLLCVYKGRCWPQLRAFQNRGNGNWEIDASFGSLGSHMVRLVTVNRLGKIFFDYYKVTVEEKKELRERLKKQYNFSDEEVKKLPNPYAGIPMHDLPEGIQSEAWINVNVIPDPKLKK